MRGLRIPHWLLRLLFTGTLREKPCSHRNLIQVTTPTAQVCQDCIASGDTWPELRMCMLCGYVGCCDQAKNQHARKHFQETGHPLIRSIEPNADWMWCYVDEALLAAPRAL
ncbi:MAG: UBP-type zinc finger domain-containing protein [Chloroflexi bacterium]|nr:UBP-type zinc finger domain-containing protein [Chloroflexota bacterium]